MHQTVIPPFATLLGVHKCGTIYICNITARRWLAVPNSVVTHYSSRHVDLIHAAAVFPTMIWSALAPESLETVSATLTNLPA